VVVLALAGVALAGNETLADLKARADAAGGIERAKLCLEYAHRQLTEANNQFNQGELEKGQADIREVVEYSRKAADAAEAADRHLKETEIELRKIGKRMHEVGQSLAFEDREPVEKAVDEIEQIRSELMIKMWGPQAEPKEKS